MTVYRDPQQNNADLELLSAYIDQQLTSAERAELEQRLEREPALRQVLDELRATVGLLRELPAARPPRSFTLDPQIVAPKRTWSFPWMQLGSALVAATLLMVFGFVLTRGLGNGGGAASAPMAASAPTYAAAAAEATAAPAAEATAAPAAEPPAAPAAALQAPAATAAPAPTAAPAATAAPGATAAPAAALTSVPAAESAPLAGAPGDAQRNTEALAEATQAVAAGAAAPNVQASPQPANAADAAAPTATPAGTPAPAASSAKLTTETSTPAPFLAQQVATSGSTASDTQALEQPPVASPAPSGGRSSTVLLGVLLAVIAIGGAIAWLLRRRG